MVRRVIPGPLADGEPLGRNRLRLVYKNCMMKGATARATPICGRGCKQKDVMDVRHGMHARHRRKGPQNAAGRDRKLSPTTPTDGAGSDARWPRSDGKFHVTKIHMYLAHASAGKGQPRHGTQFHGEQVQNAGANFSPTRPAASATVGAKYLKHTQQCLTTLPAGARTCAVRTFAERAIW